MTTHRRSAAEIRRAREENQGLRERDLAARLGISEAEFVAAWCGQGTIRIEPRVEDVLKGLEQVGEVMALTRNEYAVHEKIGVYENVRTGAEAALVLGKQIDLRIFPKRWAHGFAVEKREGDQLRRSLQFFDGAGDAVHKVIMRPATDESAWQRLVEQLASADQSDKVAVNEVGKDVFQPVDDAAAKLRSLWEGMTDVHQFFSILKKVGMSRHDAVKAIGADLAWQVGRDSVTRLLEGAVADRAPIMCFVGNRGCIQIHTGPIHVVKPVGPWINVLDETFNLHLRADKVAEVWVVRRPVEGGHVTSVEAYCEDRELILQFFGERHEGEVERADWRSLAERLPRLGAQA
jgi:putative hemin transport protein